MAKPNYIVPGVLFVTGLFFLLRKNPKIEVLATNAQEQTVSYKMTYKDKTITDTFKLGDQPQFVAAGVDDYFFGAYKAGLNTVELGIGFFEPNGGFKAITKTLVAF